MLKYKRRHHHLTQNGVIANIEMVFFIDVDLIDIGIKCDDVSVDT